MQNRNRMLLTVAFKTAKSVCVRSVNTQAMYVMVHIRICILWACLMYIL